MGIGGPGSGCESEGRTHRRVCTVLELSRGVDNRERTRWPRGDRLSATWVSLGADSRLSHCGVVGHREMSFHMSCQGSD